MGLESDSKWRKGVSFLDLRVLRGGMRRGRGWEGRGCVLGGGDGGGSDGSLETRSLTGVRHDVAATTCLRVNVVEVDVLFTYFAPMAANSAPSSGIICAAPPMFGVATGTLPPMLWRFTSAMLGLLNLGLAQTRRHQSPSKRSCGDDSRSPGSNEELPKSVAVATNAATKGVTREAKGEDAEVVQAR